MNDRAHLIALNHISGLGPVRLKLLMDYFQDPKLAWEAARSFWEEIKIPVKVIEDWERMRSRVEPERLYQQILDQGIKIMTVYDAGYPPLLKEIYDPPMVIYYLGEIPTGSCVAVVGTRKVTSYGRLVTQKFATHLAEAGIVIVSGLARGVDSIAHRSAVEAKAMTVAVLGGGLNSIFPPDNQGLAEEICNGHGAVISEFRPDEPSLPGNFPSRNRIISGMSKAVLVTEAAEDSGSLITARCALEQSREVFAIPGPITSLASLGSLSMIKQGARLVTNPEEILVDLGLDQVLTKRVKVRDRLSLTDEESKILGALALENKHVDEICRELGLSAAAVSAALVKMEIFGLVKNLGGGVYLKV